MKKIIIAGTLIMTLSILAFPCIAQQQQEGKGIYILSASKEVNNVIASVDAYLFGNVMEVLIEGRITGEKPKIGNVLIVGPELGRIPCSTREFVFATLDDAKEKYRAITNIHGEVATTQRTKVKRLKGTPTTQVLKFDIPPEKILLNEKYQLWVTVETIRQGGKKPTKFKFDLDRLPELIAR